jgi:hypothetical protein
MTGKPDNGQTVPHLVHVSFDRCDHTQVYRYSERPRVGEWKACAACGQLRQVAEMTVIDKPVRNDANS